MGVLPKVQHDRRIQIDMSDIREFIAKNKTIASRAMPRNYGQGRVYQRPGSRNLHIACCIDGKEYRESARSPKRSAANVLLIKRLAEVQSGIGHRSWQ